MKPRILVVDDDKSMVKTLCDILRLRGWQVHAAHSGEEAVAIMRATPSSHVLMDIKMPGIDGIAASQAIRDSAPDTRVILMSAHSSPGEIDQARATGVRFISKPIDLPSLFAMLV
jgi:CheY-like chemotaxis protein